MHNVIFQVIVPYVSRRTIIHEQFYRIGLDLASCLKNKNDLGHINGSSLPGSSSSSTNTKDQAVKDLTIYIASVPGQMTPLGTPLALTQVLTISQYQNKNLKAV